MGNKATDGEKRRRLRRRLEAQGVPAAVIEKRLRMVRDADLAKREFVREKEARKQRRDRLSDDLGRERRRIEQQQARDLAAASEPAVETDAELAARLYPDDRKYRPRKVDPLLTGAGRATGVSAKAVRRGKSFTEYEVDELEQKQAAQ